MYKVCMTVFRKEWEIDARSPVKLDALSITAKLAFLYIRVFRPIHFTGYSLIKNRSIRVANSLLEMSVPFLGWSRTTFQSFVLLRRQEKIRSIMREFIFHGGQGTRLFECSARILWQLMERFNETAVNTFPTKWSFVNGNRVEFTRAEGKLVARRPG